MSESEVFMASEGVILSSGRRVHRPDAYSAFLLESLYDETEGPFLDLCCGSGFFGVVMAKRGLNVTAVDISAAAVETARINASINGLSMQILQGDLFEPLTGLRFMTIVATPPVMPTPADGRSPIDWYHLANEGGRSGRDVYDRILASVRNYLLPGGCVWLLHPWFFSILETSRLASAFGLSLQCVATRLFPIGDLSRRRLPYIQSLGFIPEYGAAGQPMQKMHLIRLTS